MLIPEPLREIVTGEPFERWKLRVPRYAVVLVGANLTLPLKLCPGARVVGKDGPE